MTPGPDPDATSRKKQSRESHMTEREWHRARLPADAAGVKPGEQPVTGTIRTYLRRPPQAVIKVRTPHTTVWGR